ncbi:MAG TPA: hypothetical protein VN868_10700 [Terriglobales bacterium]|jgi:hypothetical protein|nr:hypothetical protein [Terriglobales bacterium]
MVSTLTILAVSVLSLFLVWRILRPGLPEIRSLDDWETKKLPVDLETFRILLEPGEEQYMRRSLAVNAFRRFQRQRVGLALRGLQQVGKNAAMLMRLGQLAKASANPRLSKEAEDLIHAALRLRVNLLFLEPCLWLKWLFPGWNLSVPALEVQYEELLGYLGRVRRQQWTFKHSVMAS